MKLMGQSYKRAVIIFGEKVFYHPVVTASHKMNKLPNCMEEGIFLGIRESSNRFYVGTDNGVFRTRSIKRVPGPDRYDRDMLDKMVGIRWKMIPNAEGDVINTLAAIVDMPASN